MKNLTSPEIQKFRDHAADKLAGTRDSERASGGAFLVMRQGGLSGRIFLRVVASTGEGWDHVSVSLSDRTPKWEEMEFIKRLFFKDDETAFQLHVPPSHHINNHPFCLHIWRPHGTPIPLPPPELVGIPGLELTP